MEKQAHSVAVEVLGSLLLSSKRSAEHALNGELADSMSTAKRAKLVSSTDARMHSQRSSVCSSFSTSNGSEQEAKVFHGEEKSATADAADVQSRSSLAAVEEVRVEQSAKAGFECHMCRHVFARRSNLNKHLKQVHEGVRPHGCEQCGLRFGQKASLSKHISVVHDKIKGYHCTQCNASFGQSGDLNVHVRTVHEKQRPHSCEQCGASFGLRSHLLKHCRVVHLNLRPHICAHCSMSFAEHNDLRRHAWKIHKSLP
mmetsp:Transcript_5661/g.15131  ORF Transcript_5661/g.15131 Transcript_5661/m.15131 type:complete len:256 (+) Transcript_5661:63-830(+)